MHGEPTISLQGVDAISDDVDDIDKTIKDLATELLWMDVDLT